ncbi:MAG: NAD-glutamate dehydrogenase [Rhizobium pusense]|nr:NAD-glutamate dehydrogenase [Agrobacterium pusense]
MRPARLGPQLFEQGLDEGHDILRNFFFRLIGIDDAAATRLGKREGKSHVIFDFPPEHPGHPELIEIFSADMPFIVDSVLAAIRAKGGVIRFMSHPVLHLDPESHRLLDEAAPVSVNESLLLVQIEVIEDPEARQALLAEIDGTLTETYRATRSWRTMLERLRRVVEDWKLNPPRATTAATSEAKEFLAWLAEHSFTFLGMREYRLEGEGADRKLHPLITSGVGILEDKDFHFLRAGTDYVEMTDQHVAWLNEPDPIMVTKANVRTRVHRHAYMDYVGVKLYREGGEVSGELRIVGLFTSAALATPHADVPLIRRKVSEVDATLGLRSERPCRQDADVGARFLPARRAVPDRAGHPVRVRQGNLRPRRPAAGTRAAAHRPLRQFRLDPRLRAA